MIPDVHHLPMIGRAIIIGFVDWSVALGSVFGGIFVAQHTPETYVHDATWVPLAWVFGGLFAVGGLLVLLIKITWVISSNYRRILDELGTLERHFRDCPARMAHLQAMDVVRRENERALSDLRKATQALHIPRQERSER